MLAQGRNDTTAENGEVVDVDVVELLAREDRDRPFKAPMRELHAVLAASSLLTSSVGAESSKS